MDDVKIQHALSGGEVNLKDVGKVDGFKGQTVYEFQGCFWHGCKKCYSDDTNNTKNQIDMLTLRKRTLENNSKIRAAGYELIEIYECELNKNNDFNKFLKTWDREIIGSLNPRDAFFGLWTYDFKEGEKGRYVDFCSLYPTLSSLFQSQNPTT